MLLLIVMPLTRFVPAASPDEDHSKNVLVVNSYHSGYSWSDEIMRGVRSVLDEVDDLEVFVEHLDTKRHLDTVYLRRMEELIRYKYSDQDIHLIITSDDNALDFVLSMRGTFFPGIPLVFCGIDHVNPKRISGHGPIYGVEERDGTKSTVDLVLSIHRDLDTLFFVADQTPTGILMLENVRSIEPAYENIVDFSCLTDMSADEVRTALRELPSRSAVLYLSFIRDRSGEVFSTEDSMRLVADSSPVPVYCTWVFSLVQGS